MIVSTQITNNAMFAFVCYSFFKLLCRKVLFINRKDRKCSKVDYKKKANFTGKLLQDYSYAKYTFEIRKGWFINAFLIYLTVPLNEVFVYEIIEYLWNLLFQKLLQAVYTPQKIRFHKKFKAVSELLLWHHFKYFQITLIQ